MVILYAFDAAGQRFESIPSISIFIRSRRMEIEQIKADGLHVDI